MQSINQTKQEGNKKKKKTKNKKKKQAALRDNQQKASQNSIETQSKQYEHTHSRHINKKFAILSPIIVLIEISITICPIPYMFEL